MPVLFANKYRIETARLKGWDYSDVGYYFVTICTKNRTCCLGKMQNGKMKLSRQGRMINDIWQSLPNHHSIQLDVFQIMPNHIHFVLVILPPRRDIAPPRRDIARNVSTFGNVIGGSLSCVIRSFKSECTKRIRRMGYNNFAWQSRFYDHIIRNEQSLNRIRQYIIDNPKNWEDDRNNPNSLVQYQR